MARICYKSKKFTPSHELLIGQANEIIEDYQEQGFTLTLRQIYYQYIAKDLFPDSWIDAAYNLKHGLAPDTKNTVKNYKKLGGIINDAKLAGEIDWLAIEDRTRSLKGNQHWDSPSELLRSCARQFKIDKWATQPSRVEVWIEKDALVGVIEDVCRELDVDYFSCRGYTSGSALWRAAQRMRRYYDTPQHVTVLHLGDHDPSGIDMTRDIRERLQLFSGVFIDVNRVALNMDQIKHYNPPPNPAKLVDPRAGAYIEEYGNDSWELDALTPRVMEDLIRDAVYELRDVTLWDAAVEEEKEHLAKLQTVADTWDGAE